MTRLDAGSGATALQLAHSLALPQPVIEALEQKIELRRTYDNLDNVKLATL